MVGEMGETWMSKDCLLKASVEEGSVWNYGEGLLCDSEASLCLSQLNSR